MTSLFLYRTKTPPPDLNDRVLEPSRKVTVQLNTADFMSAGAPTSYANPSQVPFVKLLFNGFFEDKTLGSWMAKWGELKRMTRLLSAK
jgi:hypothetical protein